MTAMRWFGVDFGGNVSFIVRAVDAEAAALTAAKAHLAWKGTLAIPRVLAFSDATCRVFEREYAERVRDGA